MDRTAVKVGIISAILIASIASLILWKSDLKYRASGYKVVGTFENIAGLLKGADVRYRGFRVGRVANIHPGPKEITVDFWINRDIKIPEGSTAKILFDGLVGENYVGIEPNPYETKMLQHNSRIDGITGSNLANFIDLGSKNLVHAEAILNSLRKLLTSPETSSAFNNIVSNFNTMATDLSRITSQLSNVDTTRRINTILSNLEIMSTRLERASNVLIEDGHLAETLNKMASDLAEMSANLKSMTDGNTPSDLKSTIANLESFSSRLNNLFPEETGEGSNIFKTLSSVQIKSEASLRYASAERNAYYNANIDFKTGKYFLKTGFGNRSGENQFLHFQQGIFLTPSLATRLGLFYQKTGIGFDLYPTNRTELTVEIYEWLTYNNDYQVDILSKYELRKDLDFLIGVRKNLVDRKFNNIDTGVSYHF